MRSTVSRIAAVAGGGVAALLALVALGQDARKSPMTEAELASRLRAPPGFDATLFAAPPNVLYPTALEATPGGELFVAIDENGSIDAGPNRGRVVRVIDADHDGHADRQTTFATMDSPRGVSWDGRTLYVVHPPLVTAYRDEDGDGTADKADDLVTGLGFDLSFRGADHTTNGCRLGIDGWLYIAVGDYGAIKAVGKDGTTLTLKGGGVARVRTDGSGLELVSRGQRNIYDVAVSPTLDLFTRDNTNDGDGWDVHLSHVVAGGNYGYPTLFKHFADDALPPLADYGGGSPVGSLFVDEPGLPGGLFTVEWKGRIYRHPLTPQGAGWKAGVEEWLALPRPTDMDVDGSGRIYVSSWEGAVFTYAGPNAGYVIRLVAHGAKPGLPPALDKLDARALVELLASPSGVWRLASQHELVRRGPRPGLDAALVTLAKSSGPLAGRVAAIFTLRRIFGSKAHPALQSLAAEADLRELALKALSDDVRLAARLPARPFVAALSDGNPRVRLQAVTALARLGKNEAAPALFPLVADSDPVVAHVATNALVTLRAGQVALRALDRFDGRTGPGALRILQALYEPALVEGLVARLRTARDPALRHGILRTLFRLHQRETPYDGKWWGTRPDSMGPLYKGEAWAGTPKIQAVIERELKASQGDEARWFVSEIGRHRVAFAALDGLLLDKAGKDTTARLAAVQTLFSSTGTLSAEGRAILMDLVSLTGEPDEFRARALHLLYAALGKGASFDDLLAAFAPLSGRQPPPRPLATAFGDFTRDVKWAGHLRELEAAVGARDTHRRELALSILVNLSGNQGVAKEPRAAMSKLLQSRWASASQAAELLGVIGRVRARHFADDVRARLGDKDHTVAEAAEFALTELHLDKPHAGAPAKKIAELPFENVVARARAVKGDRDQGGALFVSQGCVACHTVAPGDPPKGPFLGGIANRYSRAELCESVLRPSAKIAQGFESQWLKTKSGEELDGFVTREAGDEVELRNITGASTVIKKSNIAARGRRPDSIMPVGLVDMLTPEELASLLTYLESTQAK